MHIQREGKGERNINSPGEIPTEKVATASVYRILVTTRVTSKNGFRKEMLFSSRTPNVLH